MDGGDVHFVVHGVKIVIWLEIRTEVDPGSRLAKKVLFDEK